MIEPTQADIGRRVRLWTRHREERLGIIASFDESSVWVRYDYDPTPRKTMRCLLTYVKLPCSQCKHDSTEHDFEGFCRVAGCDCNGWRP